MTFAPRLIALCGNPHSGKSEVQKILSRELDYVPVDDAMPLRAFCIQHLGMTHNEVSSQEGKAGVVEILGKKWTRRAILGEYGKVLATMFGPDILPHMACVALDADRRYSFGSVRSRQAAFYKSQGALIIGIRNPLAGPSQHDFDWFDPELVDVWIDNTAQSKGMSREEGLFDLEIKVLATLSAHQLRADMKAA
jgi:hypothetical protein